MEDTISKMEKKFRLIDIVWLALLIAFIVGMSTAVKVSIQSQKEHMRSLEESGLLIKGADSREYELGKVEAFGHEYITFHNGSSFGVEHSPNCPCKVVKESERK